MNAAIPVDETRELRPEQYVPFARRFVVYTSLWACAALAFQCFLPSEGATETDLTTLQQHLLWPVYTLPMVVVGLAYSWSWPHAISATAPYCPFGCIVVHALASAIFSQRRAWLALSCAQAAYLAVGVIYFVRQAYLPTGP